MTILQKISVGGFDQQIIDELKLRAGKLPISADSELVLAMCDQIEDTLDHEDLKDERDMLAAARDALEDEITELENKIEPNSIRIEDLTKEVNSLKADNAMEKMKLLEVNRCLGMHTVT